MAASSDPRFDRACEYLCGVANFSPLRGEDRSGFGPRYKHATPNGKTLRSEQYIVFYLIRFIPLNSRRKISEALHLFYFLMRTGFVWFRVLVRVISWITPSFVVKADPATTS